MYNGVINVYKEPGFTSFDVVAKLRGILKQKKIPMRTCVVTKEKFPKKERTYYNGNQSNC